MNASLLFRSIFARIWRFKARTLAMGLGIVIAVLASVLLQTVATGAKSAFIRFIEKAYPADALVLMGGSGPMGGGGGRRSVKPADVETIVSTMGLREWDPMVFGGMRDVNYSGNVTSVSVVGHSERAETVRRRSVREGEFLSVEDVEGRARVALIGRTTADTLFPGESPVGMELFIDNLSFTVKGVLEPAGVDPHGIDMDNTIHVPWTTLMETMLHIDYFAMVTFIVEDLDRVDAAREQMLGIMRESHSIGPDEEDDFSIFSAALMRAMVDRSFRTFTAFVPLIAGTAFLISALVVLAIMQVSMRGRIAEIGLRKAVGARPRDLETQIVLEVAIVAIAASLAGVILARIGITIAEPMLLAKMGVEGLSMSTTAVLISVAAAIVTGIAGGVFPARRAARLDPVVALR